MSKNIEATIGRSIACQSVMKTGFLFKIKSIQNEKNWSIQRRYLSIVINDEFEADTIKAILDAASTGDVGDGKIFVSDIKECYRIRTGERGGNTLK